MPAVVPDVVAGSAGKETSLGSNDDRYRRASARLPGDGARSMRRRGRSRLSRAPRALGLHRPRSSDAALRVKVSAST